jgi:uncharacterized protein (TIGR02246 family)
MEVCRGSPSKILVFLLPPDGNFSLQVMTRTLKQLTGSLAAVVLLAASFMLVSPAQAKPNEMRVAYNNWVTAIETADCVGTKVSSLYTKDGILLATFSNEVIGRKAITRYFDSLTCNDDLSVKTQSFTSGLNGDLGWATGLYTFSYTDKSGETVIAPARYTFVFEKTKSGWKIVNHHSSVRPE